MMFARWHGGGLRISEKCKIQSGTEKKKITIKKIQAIIISEESGEEKRGNRTSEPVQIILFNNEKQHGKFDGEINGG